MSVCGGGEAESGSATEARDQGRESGPNGAGQRRDVAPGKLAGLAGGEEGQRAAGVALFCRPGRDDGVSPQAAREEGHAARRSDTAARTGGQTNFGGRQ